MRAWSKRLPEESALDYAQASRELEGLPEMTGARLLEVLADGPTNSTWLVEHTGKRWVLRLDKPDAQRLGLDRGRECAAAAAAAAAGLTVAYSTFDLERGYCLRPFVVGTALVPADLDRDSLAQLAALLRVLHALPAVGAPFDPVASARRYATQLATASAFRLAGQAAELYAAIPPSAAPPALCHNDLVCANVLRVADGGLLLIDWEYAAPGDPYFDLAVVVRHHGLDPSLAQCFLAAWLGRVPDAAERERLARYGDFYACLLELWNQRVSYL